MFVPSSFRGMDSENADAWLLYFEKYTIYRGSSDADKLHLLALLLQDAASDWYDSLDDGIKADWSTLKDVFKQRYQNMDTTILHTLLIVRHYFLFCLFCLFSTTNILSVPQTLRTVT